MPLMASRGRGFKSRPLLLDEGPADLRLSAEAAGPSLCSEGSSALMLRELQLEATPLLTPRREFHRESLWDDSGTHVIPGGAGVFTAPGTVLWASAADVRSSRG